MTKRYLFICGILLSLLVVSCSKTITTTEVREEIIEREMNKENEEHLVDESIEGLTNKAYDLLHIIDDVMLIEEYQPGYPTWHGWHELGLPRAPGAQPGVGWANAISNEILFRNDCDTDPILDEHLGKPSINYTTSRKMIRNVTLAAESTRGEIVELDSLSMVQQLANQGKGILATGISKDSRTVHVGIVVPNEDGFDVENGPLIVDAGMYMDIVTAHEWKERREVSIRYFLLRCNN